MSSMLFNTQGVKCIDAKGSRVLKITVDMLSGVVRWVWSSQRRKKNLERFTNLRVILAQGPC